VKSHLDFSGKTVLVTGATRGIGKAVANSFRESNASLILTGTDSSRIQQLNDDLKSNNNDSIKYYAVDFLDDASVEKFLSDLSRYTTIDVCVNNAGINVIDEFVSTRNKDYEKILKVNLNAPYRINKAVASLMMKNQYGRIVNVASIWSIITRAKRSLYTMSKNALHGMTQTMAVELAQYNIMVNTVSPGFTITELTESTNTKEELENIIGIIPARRMATPIEIARVILFLSHEYNSYMTGQNIAIDGGYVSV
jgi:3-oxoacyl-[acyl-carrier protein] reductase